LGETRKSDRGTRGSTSLGAVGTKRPRHGRFKADVREHRDGPPKRSEHRETLLPPKPEEEIGPNRSLRNRPAIHCRLGLWKQARCRSTQFRFGWHSKVGHILGFVGEASSDFASHGALVERKRRTRSDNGAVQRDGERVFGRCAALKVARSAPRRAFGLETNHHFERRSEVQRTRFPYRRRKAGLKILVSIPRSAARWAQTRKGSSWAAVGRKLGTCSVVREE